MVFSRNGAVCALIKIARLSPPSPRSPLHFPCSFYLLRTSSSFLPTIHCLKHSLLFLPTIHARVKPTLLPSIQFIAHLCGFIYRFYLRFPVFIDTNRMAANRATSRVDQFSVYTDISCAMDKWQKWNETNQLHYRPWAHMLANGAAEYARKHQKFRSTTKKHVYGANNTTAPPTPLCGKRRATTKKLQTTHKRMEWRQAPKRDYYIESDTQKWCIWNKQAVPSNTDWYRAKDEARGENVHRLLHCS